MFEGSVRVESLQSREPVKQRETSWWESRKRPEPLMVVAGRSMIRRSVVVRSGSKWDVREPEGVRNAKARSGSSIEGGMTMRAAIAGA